MENKDILNIIIDNFNSLDLELVNNSFLNNSFIEQVYESIKNDKQYKLISKIIEPYIINYKMIKNTTHHLCLSDVNSVILFFSGVGELYLPLLSVKYNEIYAYDKNENINLLFAFNNKISYGMDIKKNIIHSDIIHDNSINKKVDLIICNISLDFKNIIYANCNNIIKNLKIRGTKSEPLILQLISQLINKNGKIILYTPNSLLFSESNQHIETRKYLVNNFSRFSGKTYFIVDGDKLNENFVKASSNLHYISAAPSVGLNVYDIVKHEYLVLTKSALNNIESRLSYA